MANLDTRSKRASSVGIMLFSIAAPVLPDGAFSQGDREHIAVSYSGLAATAPLNPAFEMVYWEGEVDSSIAWTGEIEAAVYWEGEVDTSITEGGII